MKKVLQVVGGLGNGGLERVAINYYKYIDKTKYSFDYLVFGNEKKELEYEVRELGANIYRVTSPSDNLLKFQKDLKKVIKEHGTYDIVHAHTFFTSGIVARVAKSLNVPKIVVQSHNTHAHLKISKIKLIYRNIMRNWIKRFATDYIAVSEQSGQYVFGENFFRKYGVVINNGIKVEKFLFDNDLRQSFRKEFKLENNIVIGNTSRLVQQKNPEFLIRLMPHILKENSSFKLVLVGDGDERYKLKKIINDLNLKNSVLLMGNRYDIPRVLQGIDIFAFPSIHEGLGISLVEAQASSLPCVISNFIPREAIINDSVYEIDLENPKKWVDKILSLQKFNRENEIVKIEQAGYDIDTMMKQLTSIYNHY